MTTTYQKNLWRLALGGTFAAMAAAAGCSANEFPASSATDRDRGQAGAAAGGTAGGGDGGGGETPGATDDPVSCVELEQGPCPAEHDAALTQGAGLVPAPRCHFKLELNPEGIATERALEALALELDTVALPDVLTENSPAMVTVPLTEPELARIDGLVAAMQWADRDSWDRSWMPQGISGSADAAASGRIGGRNYLAVSWYHKPEDDPATNTNYGSRISLIDVTDVDSGVVRYEHALLVRPAEMDDGPNLVPVPIHVGGLAWVGQRLFVADTANGLRVFDTSRVFRVNPELSGIGRNAQTGSFAAHGYALALPQIGMYQIAKEGCWHRFSFVSADVTSEPPVLITGEYHGRDVAGKLLTWPLFGERLGVDDASTFVFPQEAFYAQQPSVQGAVRANGSWYLSCSIADGRMFRTGENEAHETHGWVIGPEDMMYQSEGDLLWSVSEFTGRRFVFSLKRPLSTP